MRRNEFKTYHPVVNLLYFVFVIGFSMVFMHPVCLGISFLAGYVYLPVLKGPRKAAASLLFVLPVFLIMAAINPAFNHEGVTILSYLPSGIYFVRTLLGGDDRMRNSSFFVLERGYDKR